MTKKYIIILNFKNEIFLGKFGFIGANAATVTDNLNAGGVHISDKPPANLKMSWIDTKNDGVMKYWNGSAWTPIRSTWDE